MRTEEVNGVRNIGRREDENRTKRREIKEMERIMMKMTEIRLEVDYHYLYFYHYYSRLGKDSRHTPLSIAQLYLPSITRTLPRGMCGRSSFSFPVWCWTHSACLLEVAGSGVATRHVTLIEAYVYFHR